ncbi:chemotaxis protein CheB [Stutzerimonas zhaodongensis]|uniref:chemotaxis protein CheB n=1 Tax=Stutzerimonas zhaodongensis TaxID=1176257 RepID=UPI0021078DF0|nr:chemotaxis protein CheB [Stutzerimonas zhaodongensis]MCQ2028166.1 chemotaxis protein CheB [Stutzerimonas zhaodongensis]
MSDVVAARIGVIADTSLQRHVLQQALTANGYTVVLNSDPARLEEADLAAVDADLWLVDLAQTEDSPLVNALLERDACPVLFGEGHAPERHSEHYPRWERRMFGKLKRLVGDPSKVVGPRLEVLKADAERSTRLELPGAYSNPGSVDGEPAREVWLLAASLGGPEAVKAFLDALPLGLPVGFVYAQHIEASFESALSQAVGRHSQWSVNPARANDSIRCGEVVVAPISQEMGFDKDGSMLLHGRGWPEPYSPSIDQMMLNLAQQFGNRCGVIAFSGMGSDGNAAAAYVLRQGAKVWTQRADSCVCSSMPDSLREGGYSSVSGDPRELAQALVNHFLQRASTPVAALQTE